METFTALYSGNDYEIFTLYNRMFGPYAPLYWAMLGCNVLVPQVLWFRRARASVPLLFVVALLVNIGMWLERFTIIVMSLHRDFLPSSWGMYYPTFWDWGMFLGTISFFLFAFLHFVRLLPMIAMFEMRLMVPRSGVTGVASAPDEHIPAREHVLGAG